MNFRNAYADMGGGIILFLVLAVAILGILSIGSFSGNKTRILYNKYIDNDSNLTYSCPKQMKFNKENKTCSIAAKIGNLND